MEIWMIKALVIALGWGCIGGLTWTFNRMVEKWCPLSP